MNASMLRYQQDQRSAWSRVLTATRKRHDGAEDLDNPTIVASGRVFYAGITPSLLSAATSPGPAAAACKGIMVFAQSRQRKAGSPPISSQPDDKAVAFIVSTPDISTSSLPLVLTAASHTCFAMPVKARWCRAPFHHC